MAFLTVYAGPIAVAHIGWKTWIWFAIFNVLGFPYGKFAVTDDHDVPELIKHIPVYFFIFETRGRTLEDVNELFDKNNILDHTLSSGGNSDMAEKQSPIATEQSDTNAFSNSIDGEKGLH